jgi:adenosylmethionine-8-amino-7-oxononanoate aminotransferase
MKSCGMGRTGTMHALEQDDVTPEIAVIGNGLAAGYLPIDAVLARRELVERLNQGAGALRHGHAYTGHPVAAAAALAVHKVIERDDLLAKLRVRGETLRRLLREAFGKRDHVGDIRGRGLFMALELVRERGSREPFDAARRLHAAVKAQAMARGLMVFPGGGTIDGVRGDHALIAPPFIATDSDLADIVARLADALDAALVYGMQKSLPA